MFFNIHVFLLNILLKVNHGFDVRPYNDLIRFYSDIIVLIKFPSCSWITAAHDAFYLRFKLENALLRIILPSTFLIKQFDKLACILAICIKCLIAKHVALA